jgi:hypothetical protein
VGIVNGMGSIGPIVQEQVIGRLLSDQSRDLAIYDTNLLALSISIILLVLLGIICWRIAIIRRKIDAEMLEISRDS